MMYINIEKYTPEFTLDKEGVFEYIYHFAGFKDINISNHPDFSKRFYLSGKNTTEIKKFFTDELILFFESNKYYHIEGNKKGLLIIGRERLAGIKEIKTLADFGVRLKKTVCDKKIALSIYYISKNRVFSFPKLSITIIL
mgnify:CR=1 FL=1